MYNVVTSFHLIHFQIMNNEIIKDNGEGRGRGKFQIYTDNYMTQLMSLLVTQMYVIPVLVIISISINLLHVHVVLKIQICILATLVYCKQPLMCWRAMYSCVYYTSVRQF